MCLLAVLGSQGIVVKCTAAILDSRLHWFALLCSVIGVSNTCVTFPTKLRKLLGRSFKLNFVLLSINRNPILSLIFIVFYRNY